jgi:hypothetical protein
MYCERSCVLCMTLMLFIYVYYVLFTYTNLLDVMLLFFTIFSFNLPIFDKKMANFGQNPLENCHTGFLKNRPIYRCFQFSLFLRRLRCVSADFYRFFQKPTGLMKSDFHSSTEFLNTAPVWLRMSSYLAFKCV